MSFSGLDVSAICRQKSIKSYTVIRNKDRVWLFKVTSPFGHMKLTEKKFVQSTLFNNCYWCMLSWGCCSSKLATKKKRRNNKSYALSRIRIVQPYCQSRHWFQFHASFSSLHSSTKNQFNTANTISSKTRGEIRSSAVDWIDLSFGILNS